MASILSQPQCVNSFNYILASDTFLAKIKIHYEAIYYTWLDSWATLFLVHRSYTNKHNPLHTEQFWRNINMYLHFFLISQHDTEMAKTVEILPHGRQGTACLAYSIPWLLKIFRFTNWWYYFDGRDYISKNLPYNQQITNFQGKHNH